MPLNAKTADGGLSGVFAPRSCPLTVVRHMEKRIAVRVIVFFMSYLLAELLRDHFQEVLLNFLKYVSTRMLGILSFFKVLCDGDN